MKRLDERTHAIESEIGDVALKRVNEQIKTQVTRAAAAATTASAWIDNYLLIDFGFKPGTPFEGNSVQFYGTTGFLCSKLIDNASMQTLAPILACRYVHVTWDTATLEAVHIYGYQTKS